MPILWQNSTDSVLAADTHFQFRVSAPSALYAYIYQLADRLYVDSLERVGIEKLVLQVVVHEGTDVVAGETECHLGQVVGAE